VTDLVLFPDVDALARRILLDGLAERGVTSIKVGTQVPSPMPDRFIRVFSLPGREVCRRTQWCQVIAFVYDAAGREVRCSELAQLVAAILRAAPDAVIDGEQVPGVGAVRAARPVLVAGPGSAESSTDADQT
jgi:hypothetical protein